MNIVQKAKEIKKITKEGCTVDFENILLINEKYILNDIVNYPKALAYIKGKRALLLRIVRNNVTVSDPMTPKFVKTFSSRVLIDTKGFVISKGRIGSGMFIHFAVTAENDHLPVGTLIHHPIAQDKESITCYDTEGNPCRISHAYLTTLIPPRGKRPDIKVPDKDITIESKVIPESEVPEHIVDSLVKTIPTTVVNTTSSYVDGVISGITSKYEKILNKEFLQGVKTSVINEEDVFTDLDGNVHTSLKAVLEANETILHTRVSNKVKNIIINSI